MEQIWLFIERGGELIYAIMLVVFLIWTFLSERLLYRWWVHPRRLAQATAEWSARTSRADWCALQVRNDLLTWLEMGLDAGLPMVRMLISICPLLGLLGTVTGMIEVFDVMVRIGAGSPKPMAAGISKAILSTVAGMVGAISGLLALSLVQRLLGSDKRRLQRMFPTD